ncbi:MAG: phosphocholine cytidylyltransferase family protein [Planctomycetes bacterium]|nr:phosphocholine cytidylyltransferase family protein [Planctomycetota bacterium]
MDASPTTAVILAAGCSRRLKELTASTPKCLLDVGGTTLLDHQVGCLRANGIERILVVTGYFGEKIAARLGAGAQFVRNDVYDRTNSLFSLHLALPRCGAGMVLMNADVLFHPELLRLLLSSPFPDALLYEPGENLGEEEMKVRIEEGRVTAMAKTLEAGTYQGENLGVLKFSPEGVARLRQAASTLVEAGEVNAWAPQAFDAICRDHPIRALATRSLPWIEIDFPADLERARGTVWPRIAAEKAAGAQA